MDGLDIGFKEGTELQFLIRWCLEKHLDRWMDLRLVDMMVYR